MKGGRDGVTDERGLEKPLCYPGKDGMKTIQGTCWEEMSMELMRELGNFPPPSFSNLNENKLHKFSCLNT